MKRILCALLAVLLLLPSVAMAGDARKTTITFEADETLLDPLIRQLTGLETDRAAKGIAQLLENTAVTYEYVDGAERAVISMKGEELLSFAVAMNGNRVGMISNLFPGFVLTDDAADAADPAEVAAKAAAVDWEALGNKISVVLSDYLQSADYMLEEGVYAGEAYEGGARRFVLRLDDRDLSLVLDCILTAVVQEPAVQALTECFGVDAVDAASLIRQTLQKAALENRYEYQVCVVFDQQGDLIGLSGTAIEDGKQIATLSVGMHDEYTEIIWGYGYGGVNFYYRLALINETGADGSWNISALIDVVVDTNGVGYSLAVNLDDTTLETHVFTVSLKRGDRGNAFEGGLQSTFHTDDVEWTLIFSGQELDGSPEATAAFYIGDTDDAAVLMHVATADAEMLSVETAGLTAIDAQRMTDEDSALLESAVTDAASDLLIRLFRLLPADLMVFLGQ